LLADLMIWIGKHTQQTHLRYKVADPNQDQSDSYVRLGLLDPDPLFRGTDPDPSPGSVIQRYGSGSFYQKIIRRKTLLHGTVLRVLLDF
jgi:hypothetical protein